MRGRVAEAGVVAVVALILALVLAAPVLRAPSERIFGMEIVGRHHDPFTVMAQFTRPIALGVYSQPLTDIPGAWLARVSGPVAAYNWLVLLTFPLSAAAAFMLARHLALSPPAAAIAALAFAFSPFHLAQAAYHPHVAQTQWVPFYFLALWRCLDDARPAAVALLAVSIAAVTLSNFYGGMIAAVMTPGAVAAYWYFRTRGQPGASRRLAITVATLVVVASGGLAYVWYTAHAVATKPAAFAFPPVELFVYSARWWSYLVPPVAHPLLGSLAQRVWGDAGVRAGLLEQQVSLGWGVLGLALVALIGWALRREQRISSAAVPVLATVALVAAVCSLSPELSIGPVTLTRPAGYVYSVAPMFRSYARFGVVVQLMAVLLAAIGVERLWKSGSRRARMAGVSLLALAAAEYAVWPPSLSRDVLPTSAHRWVAGRRHAVRVLDCASLTSESAMDPWLTGERVSLHTASLDDCREPNLAGHLSAAGYTHLLVRRHSEEGRWFATEPMPAGLQVAARFRDSEVLAVMTSAPPIYTDGMTTFYPREHDATWTWRWMGREGAWTVVNAGPRPVEAVLDLELLAFQDRRGLTCLLDGREVETLMVEPQRRMHRIGPLTLGPGRHALVFRPADPGTIVNALVDDDERRLQSFAIGTWQWSVDGDRP
jgi:hypothetical protein